MLTENDGHSCSIFLKGTMLEKAAVYDMVGDFKYLSPLEITCFVLFCLNIGKK